MRKTGILLSISSLPSKYGIGSLGSEAFRFVDFLVKTKQSYWQVLPVGHTSYGDSPYQTLSAFAGNPYFIDFDLLIADGLLNLEDLKEYPEFTNKERIDYKTLYENRFIILRKAFKCFNPDKNYEDFINSNSYWLDDYAIFMNIKNIQSGVSWINWPAPIKRRQASALKYYLDNYQEEIDFWKFVQFLFFKQWNYLKYYANNRGIKIIGDIPIYVSLDSADVWANKKLFKLDKKCLPILVAGCPPDDYAIDGQLWGNPVYDWNKNKTTKYAWWISRIKASFQVYNVLRIDHFRGFDSYYAIPYGHLNAKEGTWEIGPKMDLFNAVKKCIGEADIIAEDLGFLTDGVRSLLAESGFPGMKVLQFAFSDDDYPNEYKPHLYPENSVAYTGTHDNPTTKEWLSQLDVNVKKKVYDYANIDDGADAVEKLIKTVLFSKAKLTIIPLQDYLDIGQEGRMNKPGTMENNWQWRFTEDFYSEDLIKKIRRLTTLYNRD